VLPQDESGNVRQAPNALLMNSHGTLVYAENAPTANQPSERIIVALGTEDLIIVDTGDVLLVCPKSQAQQIRQVVATLKQENSHLI
jgi:mannose-1-phosphate guanylyltransferase